MSVLVARIGDILRSPMLIGMAMGVVSRVLTVLLSFGVTLLLARLLGAEGFGEYALAVSVMTVLGRLAILGLPELMLREVAGAAGDDRTRLLNGLLRWALGMILVGSSIVAGLYCVFSGENPLAPGFWDRPVSWAIFFLVPLGAMIAVLSAILNGLSRISETIWLGELLRMAVFLALLVLLALAIGFVATPVLAIQLSAIASAVLVAVLVTRLYSVFSEALGSQSKAFKPREWVRATAALGIIGLVTVGYQQADILMLGWLADPASIGNYHAANRLSNLLTFFTGAAAIPLAPMIAESYRAGDFEKIRKNIWRALSLVFAAISLPLLILLFFGEQIIEIALGSEFRDASAPLEILSAGRLAGAGIGVFTITLKMCHQNLRVLLPLSACLVVNVIGNAVLIPSYGIVGAAYATTISWIVLALSLWLTLWLWLLRRPVS